MQAAVSSKTSALIFTITSVTQISCITVKSFYLQYDTLSMEIFTGPVGAILSFVHIIVRKRISVTMRTARHICHRNYPSIFPVLTAVTGSQALFTIFAAVKRLCFIAFSTSFSHFISDRPLRQLLAGGHVIISIDNNNTIRVKE